jgi:hypothetical protein
MRYHSYLTHATIRWLSVFLGNDSKTWDVNEKVRHCGTEYGERSRKFDGSYRITDLWKYTIDAHVPNEWPWINYQHAVSSGTGDSYHMKLYKPLTNALGPVLEPSQNVSHVKLLGFSYSSSSWKPFTPARYKMPDRKLEQVQGV